jgi:hypothetical protein
MKDASTRSQENIWISCAFALVLELSHFVTHCLTYKRPENKYILLILRLQELKYVVGYEDNPHLKVTVRPDKILEWVSRRTLETWESDEYRRIEKEREEAELPGLRAREAAKRKRMDKLSREGGRKVDGRRRKRKAVEVDPEKSFETPRKKGRRGRPPKSPVGMLKILLCTYISQTAKPLLTKITHSSNSERAILWPWP